MDETEKQKNAPKTLPRTLCAFAGFFAFAVPAFAVAAGTRVDFAVRLSWNNYNGRKYQQAELVDWRPAENVG